MPLHGNWQALVNTSEQMLNAAHAADWELLSELESQRSPLIRKYFLATSSQLDSEELARQLTWLQGVERELLDLCLLKRDNLSAELQGLKRGKTAGDAYLSNVS